MKKRMISLITAGCMVLSMAGCTSGGSSQADASTTSETSATHSAETAAEGAKYTIGICQLVQHDALDAATPVSYTHLCGDCGFDCAS